ncbi:MAG: hypothetical protein K6E84_07325 [Lachnospiraceae bacterium]|nr:hypothetical protein [Lachnospiraceae bacterium]
MDEEKNTNLDEEQLDEVSGGLIPFLEMGLREGKLPVSVEFGPVGARKKPGSGRIFDEYKKRERRALRWMMQKEK